MTNQNKKILIIEDEPLLLKALTVELSDLGYKVLTAADGKSGYELILKETPDFAIIDSMLRQKSGLDILADLQKLNSATKIIVISNLDFPEDKKKALQLGAVGYYVKAMTNLNKLVEIVQKHLSKK